MALRDSIHYLLFTARHHLCHLISAPVLRWEEMVPPPTIEQAKAREAVMTVVRVFAEQQRDREEGWERWESAFEGDDLAGLTQQWVNLGGREVIEQEVRELWASRIGRIWKDGEEGETVTIEFEWV